MNKHKLTLIALLAALSLTACNGGCTTNTDNVNPVQSSEENAEGTSTAAGEACESNAVSAGSQSSAEPGSSLGSTKPSDEATGSEATTEVSLEGSTVSAESQSSTKPDSSSESIEPSGSTSNNNSSVKTTEATTKAPSSDTKPAQAATHAPAATTAPKPTQAVQTSPQPTTKAPVWHEPVYEFQSIWVVDKEAWTEEVTEEVQVPVYVYAEYIVCLREGCGFETSSDDEWIAHEDMHMDKEEWSAYKLEIRKELTGYTTEYQTTYIEHPEEGHHENRWVLVSEGYWEY